MSQSQASSSGIDVLTAVGASIAVQISFNLNHSIGWAIWHGLLGFVYVVYRYLIHSY